MSEQQPNEKVQQKPQQRRRHPKKKRPSLLQRLRRQDIILLIGLVSLACLSVIVVSLLILRFQTARAISTEGQNVGEIATPAYAVAQVEVTGLSQYPLAQEKALAWSADAQLVTANAKWSMVLTIDQVGEAGEWIYHFYSPSKERLFIATVGPDGQVQGFEHIVRITLPPPVLNTGNWVVDSPTALGIWLDRGGADLIRRNPGLELLIQLRHLNNHPNPVWMVIGTDKRTQDIYIVVVDTIDGSVVTTRGSSG